MQDSLAEWDVLARGAMIQLHSQAQAMERGQADMPLAHQLAGLQAPTHKPQLELMLVCLESSALPVVLRWLCGASQQNIDIALPAMSPIVEVRLQERGFSLSVAGTTTSYESAGDLFQALMHSPSAALNSGELPSCNIGIPGTASVGEFTLHILRTTETVEKHPALIARLMRSVSCVILCAGSTYQWSPESLSAVRALVDQASFFWHWRTDFIEHTAPAWWTRSPAAGKSQLPILSLPSEEIPLTLLQAGSSLQRNLSGARMLGEAHYLGTVLQSRCSDDERQLSSRLKREQRLEMAQEGPVRDQEIRQRMDQLKQALQDDLSGLSGMVKENARKSQNTTSALSQTVTTLAQSAKPDDLMRDSGKHTIVLKLSDQALDDIRTQLRKRLRELLTDDLTMLRDGLLATQQQAEKVLGEVGVQDRTFPLPLPDDGQIWGPLNDMLNLGVRYRGELPKRGFFSRLAQGRQAVFTVMMIGSLVAGFMGFNLRSNPLVGVLFLALFVGVVGYTFWSWRKDEEMTIERELRKLHDTLETELTRVVTDIQRERTTRMTAFIDEIRRTALTRLEAVSREWLQQSSGAIEQQKREARSRAKAIEQRLRDVQNQRRIIDKALLDLTQAQRQCQEQIARDIVKSAIKEPS